MLFPRYSIRWLLGLTFAAACVSFVLSYAFRGEVWALGVAAGFSGLIVLMTLYALTFLVAWCISQLEVAWYGGPAGRDGTSPFATSSGPAAPAPPSAGLPAASDAPQSLTG